MSIFQEINLKLERKYLQNNIVRGYFFNSTFLNSNSKKHNASYDSFVDFRNTLLSPFTIPLICTAKAVELIANTLLNLAMCVLRFATLDFSKSAMYAGDTIKSGLQAIYTLLKCVIDTATSLFTFLMRTLSTGVALVSGVVDIVQSCFQP